MKKRIVSLAFLMPLVAVVFFLASCNGKTNPPEKDKDSTAQNKDTILLEYNLLSDLVLKALLSGNATSSLTANVKAVRKAGDPTLEEADAVYETVRSETNTLTASAGKVIGTCCCPCDDPMRMDLCPCPTYHVIKFIETMERDASEIMLDDSVKYESQPSEELRGFREFTLPKGTSIADGDHTLLIKGSFAKGGPVGIFKIKIEVLKGKAYFKP